MVTTNAVNEPTGASNTVLQGQGVGTASAFSTATYPATTTVSQILYSSATNTVAGLATANNGTLITGTTGIPSVLANGTTGQVLTATTGSPPSWTTAAGNVAGPGSSTDRAIATWNGTGGTALFNNSTVKISSAGIMTKTAQPCFNAYNLNNVSNVTGDGTLYTVNFDTELVDQGNNFASSTFTAPVTGNYLFSGNVQIFGLGATDTSVAIQVVTTANTLTQGYQNSAVTRDLGTGNNILGIPFSAVLPMTATDTATITVVVSGGTKTVSLLGGKGTYFSGCLLC